MRFLGNSVDRHKDPNLLSVLIFLSLCACFSISAGAGGVVHGHGACCQSLVVLCVHVQLEPNTRLPDVTAHSAPQRLITALSWVKLTE
ncbi:hypothetical protein GDO81_012492 [Engystomops pustulosus]|uniref:Secreted protein n=1 Tax=Engystomops pustulosus TaxID=76066 RepID=A0AAV7BM68_ENGPU|nr:hypothetical protein GDO81_012492 [Engystomops pustulosus]